MIDWFAVQWYALDRDTDVSGISGTGRVAYAIVLPSGRVLMLWDTYFDVDSNQDREHSRGIEHLPHLAMLRAIHCHGEHTRLTPIDDDPHALTRVQELLDAAEPLVAEAADALNHLVAQDEDWNEIHTLAASELVDKHGVAPLQAVLYTKTVADTLAGKRPVQP